jgi:Flp pilus assembly pilin Flp
MEIFFKQFWNDENGQDLIEYTLMLAFCSFGFGGSIFSSAGASVNKISSKANSQLSNAASGS